MLQRMRNLRIRGREIVIRNGTIMLCIVMVIVDDTSSIKHKGQ